MYRPPGSVIPVLRDFSEFAMQQFNSDTKLVIAGGFNVQGIDWETLSITHTEGGNNDLLLVLALDPNL